MNYFFLAIFILVSSISFAFKPIQLQGVEEGSETHKRGIVDGDGIIKIGSSVLSSLSNLEKTQKMASLSTLQNSEITLVRDGVVRKVVVERGVAVSSKVDSSFYLGTWKYKDTSGKFVWAKMTFLTDQDGKLLVKRERLLKDGTNRLRSPNHEETMSFVKENTKFVGQNKLKYVYKGIDVVFERSDVGE